MAIELKMFRDINKIFNLMVPDVSFIDRQIHSMFFRQFALDIKYYLKDKNTKKFINRPIDFQTIYPAPINQILRHTNLRHFMFCQREVSDFLKSNTIDRTNNQHYAIYILIAWFLIIYELIYPVTQQLRSESWYKGVTYLQLGFEQSEFNKIKPILRFNSLDMKLFLTKDTIKDSDLKQMEKYLKRLLRVVTSSRRINNFNDREG